VGFIYPEQNFLGEPKQLWEWVRCKTLLPLGSHACSCVPEKQQCVAHGREGVQHVWELPALRVGSIPGYQCGGPSQNHIMFTIKCMSIAVSVLALDLAWCLQDE